MTTTTTKRQHANSVPIRSFIRSLPAWLGQRNFFVCYKTATTAAATCKFMFVLTYFVLCDFKLYVLFHIMITIIIIIRCSSGYTCTISVVLSLARSLACSLFLSPTLDYRTKNTQEPVCKRQYILSRCFSVS